MKQSCSNCKYGYCKTEYHLKSAVLPPIEHCKRTCWYCRRKAPTEEGFPPTNETGWCGEWEEK